MSYKENLTFLFWFRPRRQFWFYLACQLKNKMLFIKIAADIFSVDCSIK